MKCLSLFFPYIFQKIFFIIPFPFACVGYLYLLVSFASHQNYISRLGYLQSHLDSKFPFRHYPKSISLGSFYSNNYLFDYIISIFISWVIISNDYIVRKSINYFSHLWSFVSVPFSSSTKNSYYFSFSFDFSQKF